VVVGAGLLGLAAAAALARRGADVLVLEQASAGHDGSGSKGSCRIFRLGYEDPDYVRLARLALDLWTGLEQAAGARLLHPVPQLTFGDRMPAVRQAMRQAGAAHQMLSAAEAAARFPGVAAGPGPVLLEPDSRVIAADRVLAVLAGAVPELRTGARVAALADDGRRVSVSTTRPDGAAADIDAGTVIVCAGPWTAGLLGTAGIKLRSAATLEQVGYLETAAAGQASQQWPALPVFISYGGDFPYGLPVPGSTRYKIGLHHSGHAVHPDRQRQDEDTALSARIGAVASRFLPSADPRLVAVERCVYDNTADEDFVVDKIGNIVVGSGTSGHGFKFGPLLGEWLADLAVKGSSPGLPKRFAATRF
jgi:sarcosine oxidase